MRTLTSFTFRLALVAACALIIPQTVVHAQQPGVRAVANIPFAFQLGPHQYPAGKYALELNGNHLLLIEGRSASGFMEVNWDGGGNRSAATGRLVFHHYGSRYFLREMRVPGNSEFLASAESKAERRARKEETVSANRPAGRASESNVEEVALAGPSR
jgi:hypothetical protein